LWLNDRVYIIAKVYEQTCLLGTRWYRTTFSPVHQPWEPQYTVSQTDRKTDGQTTGLCQ